MAAKRKNLATADIRSAQPKDGGAWCLVGFLYQLLGSAAVSLAAAPADPEELSANFIERHGQDATTGVGGATRLIQFKYSDRRKPIGPAELLTIRNAFRRSEKTLSARPSWVLVTNRPLSKKTERLRSGRMPRLPSERSVAIALRREKARFEIQCIHISEFRARIEARASSFGIDAIPDISQRVVGFLTELVALPERQREVTQAALDRAIAGYDGPLSISAAAPECRSRLRLALSTLAGQLQAPPLSDVLPRRDVEKILREPSVALAIVCGRGGSGKTLSVVKALHDYINEHNCLAGALMPGDFPARSTLPELVASWRSSCPLAEESLGRSLMRIRVANRDARRPVLLLALDGIDENDSQSEAGQLLGHFMDLHQKADQQEALLIVTCRDPNQLDGLIGAQGAGGDSPRRPYLVRLDDFTPEEFRDVWRRWFTTEPPDVSQSSDAESTFGQPRLLAHIARALRHPIVLGCFRALNPEQRTQFLNDEPEPWGALLDLYLEWFSVKVHRRLQLDLDIIKQILRAAASATLIDSKETTYQLDAHWIRPAEHETGLTRPELRRVFNDAVTAGIVQADPERLSIESAASRPWRWRFTQLRDHLAQMPHGIAS
jgi:hypothetical protein